MNFDAILGRDNVDCFRIEAQRVKSSKDIAGRIPGMGAERQRKKKDEDAAKPHDGV